MSKEERRVVTLINYRRGKHGLAPLQPSPSLHRSASAFAATLYRTGTFAHDATIHADRAFTWLGEILAKGEQHAGQAVHDWMRSEPHKNIILSGRARKIGAAHNGNIWVVHFGRLGR